MTDCQPLQAAPPRTSKKKTAGKKHQSVTAIFSRFVDSSQNRFGRLGRQMKTKQPIKRGRKARVCWDKHATAAGCDRAAVTAQPSIHGVRRRDSRTHWLPVRPVAMAEICGYTDKASPEPSARAVEESPHGRAAANKRNNQEKTGF